MDEKIKNTESYENIRKEITFYIDKKGLLVTYLYMNSSLRRE